MFRDAADVPFALAYLFDGANRRAALIATSGVDRGCAMAPVDLRMPDDPWDLREVIDSGCARYVDHLAARFRGHTVGKDGEPPCSALITPITENGEKQVIGVLILGTNARVALDDGYREFLRLAADTVTAKLTESHAHQRELERLARLAELDRAKTEFFSNVSHEFRTPLTLMLGPLDDLLADCEGETPARTKDLELIRRNAQRLVRLVGTLLDFSQIEAGRLRAQYAPVDLPALTRGIVAQFESAARHAGLTLRISTEPMDQPVWVDAEMWEKIVSNLLSNAIKFTFTGSIEVGLRNLPMHAELTVTDTGIGIPERELPFLFRRFHQVHGAHGRTRDGAGIGLALVDELVRQHHGRVRCNSEVGKGSTFTVWLPLGFKVHDESRLVQSPLPGQIAAAFAQEAAHWDAHREETVTREVTDALLPPESLRAQVPHARVLVIDDNPDMRDYLARLLAPPWTVAQAKNGEEGLELARRDAPDLILADVMMPGSGGLELLRTARADALLASVPIMLVTAHATEDAAIAGLVAGADDYVVKPFSSRELLARIGAQIELARLRRSSERRFRALMDASFDAVYRMSPDWTEMHVLDGRGFIADTSAPSRSWVETYIDPLDRPQVWAAINKAIATGSISNSGIGSAAPMALSAGPFRGRCPSATTTAR